MELNELEQKVVARKKYPHVFTGTELLSMKQNQIPHLWKPFINSQGLSALVGSSDVGKTSFLRQFAIAVVLKKTDFLGHELNVRYGRVLYFSTEDNQVSINALLKKQIDPSINPIDLKGLCYIFNADEPFKVIEEQLKAEKTDLVIIDAYSDIFEGNSNDIGHTRRFLNKYEKLANDYDCSIIFLHHTGKRTELGNPSKNNIIGSQGFEAKMRLVMELRKMENSNKRSLHFTKGNYLAESTKSIALELLFDNKQEFQFLGSNSMITNNSRLFTEKHKSEIMAIAEPLRKQGMSYDKIREELQEAGINKVPSKGTLYEMFSAVETVQSA